MSQDIERSVLRLWDIHHPLHDLSEMYSWRTPKCFQQDRGVESDLGLTESDSEASVLIIEDLGQIDDVFSCLERWARMEYPPSLSSRIADAGRALGASLANLHSQFTVDKIAQFPETAKCLSQSLTQELVWAVMVDPMSKYLKDLPDGPELCRRVAEDFKTPMASLSAVLSHGDFHNGNVMLPKSLPRSGHTLVPMVVDWEFAHLNGRGVNGDAAEFTAGLHCKLIKARKTDSVLATFLRQMISGFCAGYRETSGLRYDTRPDNVNLQLLRSALLFHGTEMVSCAYEYSSESDAFCEIFATGVWYLSVAGENASEFAQEGNLAQLKEEDEGIVTSLFGRPPNNS